MSGSVNKVIIIGRLGGDPDRKYTATGQSVANFSVATDEGYTEKESGKKVEKTEWHRIVVWGKLADLAAQYLSKGRQVYLEGKLQTRSWEDKEGTKRYTTEVVAFQLVFLGSKSDNQRDEGRDESTAAGPKPFAHAAEARAANAEQEARAAKYEQPPLGDDDIPF